MKKRSTKSDVYFVDMRSTVDSGILERMKAAIKKAGLLRAVAEGDFVAVKMHFGEKGSTAYLRQPYVRTVIEEIKGRGAVPFLTDTNTLYVGSRSDSVSHLMTAQENGFSYGSMGVPVIIADGLKGGNHQDVEIKGVHFSRVKIASDIAKADAMIALTHVKGHELTGFGGALKNIGMGCGSRAGKLAMHSDVRPTVGDRCIGCKKCVSWCPVGAISVESKRASIDKAVCIGCAECIVVCPSRAVKIEWNWLGSRVQEKMAEYAAGTVATKKAGKVGYLNFIMDVSPQCDCYPFSDAPIVPDVGILISLDPVAIDMASVDLINKQPAIANTAVGSRRRGARDLLRALYPDVEWRDQIKHAEKLGLGTMRYRLVKV
jgi:uncharacterized Fe-S center protein